MADAVWKVPKNVSYDVWDAVWEMQCLAFLGRLLGGSWVVFCGVISRVSNYSYNPY